MSPDDGQGPSTSSPSEGPARAEGDPRVDRSELQAKAVRGVSWTLIHTAVAIVLGFGVNIVLARVLGVTEFGRLAYLTLMITTAGQVAELGLAGAVIQFGTKAHSRGDDAATSALLRRSLGFRLLTFAPAVTIVALLVVHLNLWLLIAVILIGIWLKSFIAGALLTLSIENNTHQVAQNAIIVNVLTQAAVLGVVLTVGEADAVWAAKTVMATLGVALAFWVVNPRYRKAIVNPSFPRGFPPGFWRYALPAGAATIIGNLLVSRTEVLFLTWWDMAVAAGLYAAAFGMANHIFSPTMALVGPLIPAISGLREVDAAAVGKALRRVLRSSSTAVGLVVAASIAPVSLLIPLIYGSDYARAASAFVVLGVGAAVMTVGSPITAFLQARLGGGRILWINIASLAVNLVAILALLPLIGLWGAVVANLSGTILRVGLVVVGEVRESGLSIRAGLHDSTPLFVGVLASFAALAVASLVPGGAVLQACAAGVVGVALFVVGLALSRSGLLPEDARVIVTVVPQRVRPPLRGMLRFVTQMASARAAGT